MQNIEQLAAKTFGAVCYAGFDRVLWAVEDEHGLARGTLSTEKALNEQKWNILDEALRQKPSITDLYTMAQIITFVTDGKIVYEDLIDPNPAHDGVPLKCEPRFTIIPIEHLLQPEQLKEFCAESGDTVEFPPYEEMQICKAQRTPYTPEECDYFVTVLINGERRWLSLEPIVLLKCLSGLTVTIKWLYKYLLIPL